MVTICEASALSALAEAGAGGYDIDLEPYHFSEEALRIARALLVRGDPQERNEEGAEFFRRWLAAVKRPSECPHCGAQRS